MDLDITGAILAEGDYLGRDSDTNYSQRMVRTDFYHMDLGILGAILAEGDYLSRDLDTNYSQRLVMTDYYHMDLSILGAIVAEGDYLCRSSDTSEVRLAGECYYLRTDSDILQTLNYCLIYCCCPLQFLLVVLQVVGHPHLENYYRSHTICSK